MNRSHTDAWGRELSIGDRVRIIHRGYGARLTDCGLSATITDFTPTRIRIDKDSDGLPRKVRGSVVLRLDENDSIGEYEDSPLYRSLIVDTDVATFMAYL